MLFFPGNQKYEGIGCKNIESFTITSTLRTRAASQNFQDFVCSCAEAAKTLSVADFGVSNQSCYGFTAADSARLSVQSSKCFSYDFETEPNNQPTSRSTLSRESPPINPCAHQSHQCDAPAGSMYMYNLGGRFFVAIECPINALL